MLVIPEQWERQQQQLTGLTGADQRHLKSSVLSLDLQGTFSSRNVLPCFGFFLFFTVYGLCELPTAGKIKVNQVLPFNSD